MNFPVRSEHFCLLERHYRKWPQGRAGSVVCSGSELTVSYLQMCVCPLWAAGGSQIDVAPPCGRIQSSVLYMCGSCFFFFFFYSFLYFLKLLINLHANAVNAPHKLTDSSLFWHFSLRLSSLISICLCAVYEWSYTSVVSYKRIWTKSTFMSVVCLAADICFTLKNTFIWMYAADAQALMTSSVVVYYDKY